MTLPSVPALPFVRFFTFADVTAFVRRLAAARPGLATLESLGLSREGRPLHMLTLTDPATGPARDKPAYLIHGNIHATELAGTHAALFTARQLLLDHPRSDLLKRVAFHIVPRLNPDGAEFVVTTSGSIRSRIDRSRREPNTLYQEDIDGNGLILTLRQAHPDGSQVADPRDRRLLIRRTKDSPPPYFRTFPEGRIHDWDGSDRIRVEGRGFDWNRNWSYDWRPEPEQGGAGDFPFSEPELRALAEFIHSRPNLFGILGYHTGPAAVLRPPSTGADSDLDAADVLVLQELAEIGARHTGFPVYPVVKYHRKGGRDINLRGHFHNFSYHHLGLFGFEFELGILFNSAGIDAEAFFAATDPDAQAALARRMMAWWDRRKKLDPMFHPQTPFRHPQLGPVEIGGFLGRHLYGPTLPDLKRISRGTYAFTVEHASRHPWVKLEALTVDRIGAGLYRVRARAANRGHFPTQVSNKGKTLSRLAGVRVELRLAPGVRLLSRDGHVACGHLAGLTGSRELEWFLQGPEGRESLGEIELQGGTGGVSRTPIPPPSGAKGPAAGRRSVSC